ncbi:hypothetical protein P3S67_013889 [Capsicum chacoense]
MKWLNKLQRAVDDDENLLEEVNYEALRLKVEGQLRNLEEKSNQQVSYVNLSLSDDFFLNIKEKLEDTIETLELLEKQIGRLGLQKHLDSVHLKKSTKKNEEGEKKKKEGGEENKDGGNLTAILKSCQCEGCVSTVVKAIRSIGASDHHRGVEVALPLFNRRNCDQIQRRVTRGIGHVDKINCGTPSSDLRVSQLDSDKVGFITELEEDKLRAETRRKSDNDYVKIRNSMIDCQSKDDSINASKISMTMEQTLIISSYLLVLPDSQLVDM